MANTFTEKWSSEISETAYVSANAHAKYVPEEWDHRRWLLAFQHGRIGGPSLPRISITSNTSGCMVMTSVTLHRTK